MALTKEDVVSALRTCRDPEIPINIVDLGLIYAVDVREIAADSDYEINVKMTMTSPGCPMAQSLSSEVHRTLLNLGRGRHAKVDLVGEPVWHPSMITAEGRQHLNLA